MLSSDVKILNVTGMKVWRYQLRPTLNFMQLTPGLDVMSGLSLLLILVFAPRGFSPGTLVFPSSQKPTIPNSNSIWRVCPYCETHLINSSWSLMHYRLIACDVMAAMLVVWNNKIFLLWELTLFLCKLCEQISFVLTPTWWPCNQSIQIYKFTNLNLYNKKSIDLVPCFT